MLGGSSGQERSLQLFLRRHPSSRFFRPSFCRRPNITCFRSVPNGFRRRGRRAFLSHHQKLEHEELLGDFAFRRLWERSCDRHAVCVGGRIVAGSVWFCSVNWGKIRLRTGVAAVGLGVRLLLNQNRLHGRSFLGCSFTSARVGSLQDNFLTTYITLYYMTNADYDSAYRVLYGRSFLPFEGCSRPCIQ